MRFKLYRHAILVSITITMLVGCDAKSDMVVKKFHGIRPDDKNGLVGIANPERGFRWENRIGSFKAKWQDNEWLSKIADVETPITVTQAYCELLDYSQESLIPDKKIKKLEKSFDAVRQNGLKLLLCFRYEMKASDKGPTESIILSHIEQLKPILQKNMDIIAVLQTGFIGLYGEWHRSYHRLDKNPESQEKIITALLDILPSDRTMVLRYPRHKNTYIMRQGKRQSYQPITESEAHTTRPEARLGFSDHGFMVGQNDAATFAPRPSKDYDYMSQESLFLPMDGELFWVWNRPYGVKKDNGYEAIKRLWEHHYTLFSYAHNNSEYEGWAHKKKLGARYSLNEWKNDSLDINFLKMNYLPISDGYFESSKGQKVNRTIFEYIRDHLGYRLELQSCTYPSKVTVGKNFAVSIELVNRGFAPTINPRPIYLVLLSNKGEVHVIAKASTDIRKIYPCLPDDRKQLAPKYKIKFDTKAFPVLPAGKYKIGVWMPDAYKSLQKDSRYSIRFANRDVEYFTGNQKEYGVNVLGEIVVK